MAHRHVANVVAQMTAESGTLAELMRARNIIVVGARYDVATGALEFFEAEQAR